VAMRVIARSALKKFWERPRFADARGPLHSWYEEALRAKWRRPQDIKDQFASASICGNSRVVANVRNRGPGLRLAERVRDLLFRKLRILHRPHLQSEDFEAEIN